MEERILKNLKPEKVFYYFEEICKIPHGSGNTKKISDYLVGFAKERKLYYRQDESGNVVIKKDGKGDNTVIIQGHMDMVLVKTDELYRNLNEEGISLIVDDGFIRADQTTLGADDGIAIAYALAILDSDDCIHPPIELIVTVDEETGMLGAETFEASDIDGKLMINIDSDEEGVFISSCAGGALITADFDLTRITKNGKIMTIRINGLTSGHSGTDIIYQRANANVIMGRLLLKLSGLTGLNLITLEGGDKDNSIAPSAAATMLIDAADNKSIILEINECIRNIKNEYSTTDADMRIEVQVESYSENITCINDEITNNIIMAFSLIQDGVIKMSNDIKGLVQTSVNLGIVSLGEKDLQMSYLARSSVDSEKDYLIEKIRKTVSFLGGKCRISGVYPAWEYKKDSVLRNVFESSYVKLYGEKPVIEAIHAGVECGVFASKIKNLDCISIGPEMFDIHTVNERLNIKSVERTWNLIIDVLERLTKI